MDDVARLSPQDTPLSVAAMTDNASWDIQVPLVPVAVPAIPAYLQETYYWAYINPRNVKLLDHEWVVRTILWQQHLRLQKLLLAEIEPGQRVLQTACVYGSISANLAEHIGAQGTLDIVDVAEVQVNNARRKLQAYPQVTVHQGNVLDINGKLFDAVCCYFLLHEIPDTVKRKLINVLLHRMAPGGKVVFVDYHKPRWWHPLKPITSLVFDTLEPFAKGLWRNEIKAFADKPERYSWRKETCFAELFQKVVATRIN